ncbi:MAG: hypothetical protein E6R05_04795, partial [Candidatus Moraniibacteriota bacterium]
MKVSSRYLGVFALVSAVVFAVGCTALGGREESPPKKRGPTAIVIPQDQSPAAKKNYPPQCDAECQKIWDQMLPEERTAHLIRQIEVLDGEVDLQTRRADTAASAASAAKGGCKTAQPKPVPKKKEAKSCGSTTAALPAPAASAPAIVSAPVPVTSAASAPAFKLADPVTERRTSMVGSYDWVWDRFGYTNGQLVYRPYWGGNKSVYMTEQMADPSYECPRLRVPETDHVLRVKVTAAVNPSLLWETDYHRLVSIYGGLSGHNNPNTVTAADVKMGVKTYLG